MTVWVLSQTLTAEAETTIEQRTHLVLPFGDLPDVSRVSSEAQCRQLIASLHPELPPESITGMVDRIWKQLGELHTEDLIAVPLMVSHEVALAHVTGRYAYKNGAHLIPVGWYKRLPPRVAVKHKELFSARTTSMREIENRELRIAILEQLPHSYNRFVKWKWLLAVFFGLGMVRMIEGMIRH